MWFCGDARRNIAPYRMLKKPDVKHLKSGIQQLSMMRKVVKAVLRSAVEIVGNERLIRKHNWTPEHVITLYEGVKHCFQFPNLSTATGKNRRHKTKNSI